MYMYIYIYIYIYMYIYIIHTCTYSKYTYLYMYVYMVEILKIQLATLIFCIKWLWSCLFRISTVCYLHTRSSAKPYTRHPKTSFLNPTLFCLDTRSCATRSLSSPMSFSVFCIVPKMYMYIFIYQNIYMHEHQCTYIYMYISIFVLKLPNVLFRFRHCS